MAALFSDDDIAAFFDVGDGLGAVLAVYTVTASGAVLPDIPVLLDQPDVSGHGSGNVGVKLSSRVAYVRCADIANPRVGDTLALGGEVLKVQTKGKAIDADHWALGLAAV